MLRNLTIGDVYPRTLTYLWPSGLPGLNNVHLHLLLQTENQDVIPIGCNASNSCVVRSCAKPVLNTDNVG